MSLSNIKKMKDERGFTIVELLIVIVIIAILAAIVFVAYSNITQRARVSGYQSDAASIVKVAEAINADGTSGYPETAGEFSATIAKLPSNVRVSTTPLTTSPADADAVAVSESGGNKTYVWKECDGAGLVVYYPDGSTVKSVVAGTCTP